MRAQRFFRYVWRINAVLILAAVLLALIGIGATLSSPLFRGLGRHEEKVSQVPVVAAEKEEEKLTLQAPQQVNGTHIMRADLVAERAGRGLGSYKDSAEIRNVLFIELATGATRWLLPDHQNRVTGLTDIYAAGDYGQKAPIATVALIEPAGGLLLFAPEGAPVSVVSNGVHTINTATAVSDKEFVIVFERSGGYVLARFDASTRQKIAEQPLNVPKLP